MRSLFKIGFMVNALIGGTLLGMAAGLWLLLRGRVAGIGGLFASVVSTREDRLDKTLFLAGLLASGAAAQIVKPTSFERIDVSLGVVVLAGALVGFGMQRGAGCTSGHGICGIGRLSTRSILATLTFIGTGVLTVLLTHHVLR